MRIGLQIPHFRPSTPATMRHWLRETAQAVDQGNFDSLWVMDHFFQLGRPYAEIEKTILETADLEESAATAIIERGKFLQQLGFEHIIFNLKATYTSQALEQFNQVILPAIKEQG